MTHYTRDVTFQAVLTRTLTRGCVLFIKWLRACLHVLLSADFSSVLNILVFYMKMTVASSVSVQFQRSSASKQGPVCL